MKTLINSPDHLAQTTAATQRLERAIMLAAGDFALILACCNSPQKQQQILNLLTPSSALKIQEIVLQATDETLYTTIQDKIGNLHPEVLMITGLESVVAINQLIASTNIMRDEFRKSFHFPVVLWLNDEILNKLVWLAPDLKNWSANTIRFDFPQHQLIDNPILIA
ncbi:hypothetical protein [Nostoc sp. CMAA1605]|uniref:hypothetical protein n=1 Tax=Nostoc sp. CMAA1605 TaxID=2055159 RepID=UPI001F186090|nr:hypothetical protein [Nostoc sp. CMAA1605]MCF4967016.1 hypothetical protein [Nostoc sp. CMAA1605]